MRIDHKIIIFAIVSALVAVLSTVAYNTYDATVRVNVYKECIEANKVMAAMITAHDSETIRITSLPTCYMR